MLKGLITMLGLMDGICLWKAVECHRSEKKRIRLVVVCFVELVRNADESYRIAPLSYSGRGEGSSNSCNWHLPKFDISHLPSHSNPFHNNLQNDCHVFPPHSKYRSQW